VEYAAKAVESSGTAVGVRCKDGVVLGFEKLIISKMLVEVYSQTSCPPRSSRPALSGRLFPAGSFRPQGCCRPALGCSKAVLTVVRSPVERADFAGNMGAGETLDLKSTSLRLVLCDSSKDKNCWS